MIFSTVAAAAAFSLFGFELELVGLVKRSKGPREPCSIMFGLAIALCGDLMTMASLTHEIPNKDIQLLDFFFGVQSTLKVR